MLCCVAKKKKKTSHLCSNPVFPTTYSHKCFTCTAPEILKTKFSKPVPFPTYAIFINTSPSCFRIRAIVILNLFPSFPLYPDWHGSTETIVNIVFAQKLYVMSHTRNIMLDWLGKHKRLLVPEIYCLLMDKGCPTVPQGFVHQYLN